MNQVDPKKYYNLTELLEYTPWIKSLPTLAKWVDADMDADNILKAVKVGEGSGTRYHIKGENIINFLAKVDDGSLNINLSSSEGGDKDDYL